MKLNTNKLIQALFYIAGAVVLYLLLKPHLNFLYYPFYNSADVGYELQDTMHKFILNYNTLPLNMFVFFTAIAGIRSFIVNPAERHPVRIAIGYFLLGMYEGLVAWGLSYFICICSVIGESTGGLEFVAKYVPLIAITNSSVIVGTIVGVVTALLLFLSIPLLFIIGILASTFTGMLPLVIVMGVLMLVVVFIFKVVRFVVVSCDNAILAFCK